MGGFLIMTRFTSSRLFIFSSQRSQLRWKNKAGERRPPSSLVKNAYSTRLLARVNEMTENPKSPASESHRSKRREKQHPVLSTVFPIMSKNKPSVGSTDIILNSHDIKQRTTAVESTKWTVSPLRNHISSA